MAIGHQTRSYVTSAVNVAASATAQPVCSFGITDRDALNLKVDILLGQCAVSGTTTVTLQDSNGFGIWNSTKSATPTASTDKAVSAVDTTTSTLTSTSHGYAAGTLVTINSTGSTPGGLVAGGRYFVVNPTTNALQLAAVLGGAPLSISSAGAGTIKLSAVRVVTVVLNAQTAGDVQYLPLRPQGRLVCTTDTTDTVQVVDVRVSHLY